MKKWLKRIRGVIGMGLTWAVGWLGLGTILMLPLVAFRSFGHRVDRRCLVVRRRGPHGWRRVLRGPPDCRRQANFQ